MNVVRRLLTAGCIFLWLTAPAWAIDKEDIPQKLKDRLPTYFQFIPPQVLERLELGDLQEFAAAHDAGELYTVGNVNVKQHSGPIEPEVAKRILGLIPGIPFAERRFERVAMQAYGRMMFSRLEWNLRINDNGLADIDLRYDSNPTRFWFPTPGYDPLGGVLLGATYRDVRYGGENRTLTLGARFNEDDPWAPDAGVSLTDGTLNDGRAALTVSASVDNEWRERLEDTPEAADLRLRTAKLELEHEWRDALSLGGDRGAVGLGAGVYNLDYRLYEGDPAGSPRALEQQDGTAGFVRLKWSSSRTDHVRTPRDGHSYTAFAERHFGDFEFTRFNVDLRRYCPAANLLGHDSVKPSLNTRNEAHKIRPGAGIGVQLQANVTDRGVPFSFESHLGDADLMRGISRDTVVGSKLLAARIEYRFAANRERSIEMFIFNDHAWLGEEVDQLESFSSIGAGCLFELPVNGGIQLGAHYGTSLSGDGDEFGVSAGFSF